MASPARKFLMAGRGGLNLTHSESQPDLIARYGSAKDRLASAIAGFPPAALIAWCESLGEPTFIGSSKRVFPSSLKASPLLRRWLGRLRQSGVGFAPRHRWQGWDENGALHFDTPAGDRRCRPAATILALGGASWPRLGSDGAWTGFLPIGDVRAFRPANCGFAVGWSDRFRDRFAGTPLKRISVSFGAGSVRGEAVITSGGIEGGAIYAISAAVRDAIAVAGPVDITLDLRPDLDAGKLAARLGGGRGSQSLANHLRKAAGLPPVAIGLVQEALRKDPDARPTAALIKALPLALQAPLPIGRSISSAGGLAWSALDQRLMLDARPGVFAAGEMLDWEAPTGGYLLQACFSTGVAAARSALHWLAVERAATG